MECLLKFIKCKKCDKLLEKPIVLPCGNFICEKHQNEDREEKTSMYCSICDVNHEIPQNKGFIRVLPLDQLIEKNIECIDLGNEHQWALQQIKRFSELFEKFETFNANLEYVIHDKISELKAKVDLRREELKNQVDEEALGLIKQLENYEAECKENIVKVKEGNIQKLNVWKEDINLWRDKMDNFKKDIKMWDKINKEATDKYEQMNLAFKDVRKSIFLNQLNAHENLHVSIGRDLKNLSLTYVVENVTQSLKEEIYQEEVFIFTEMFEYYQTEWSISVTMTNAEVLRDASSFLRICLNDDFNIDRTYDAEFDIIILHLTDSSKNIIYNVTKSDDNCLMITLDELKDDGFFDVDNDCFTIQVHIK